MQSLPCPSNASNEEEILQNLISILVSISFPDKFTKRFLDDEDGTAFNFCFDKRYFKEAADEIHKTLKFYI